MSAFYDLINTNSVPPTPYTALISQFEAHFSDRITGDSCKKSPGWTIPSIVHYWGLVLIALINKDFNPRTRKEALKPWAENLYIIKLPRDKFWATTGRPQLFFTRLALGSLTPGTSFSKLLEWITARAYISYDLRLNIQGSYSSTNITRKQKGVIWVIRSHRTWGTQWVGWCISNCVNSI